MRGRRGVCAHLGDPRDVIVLVEVGHPVRELLQVPLELLLLRPHLLLQQGAVLLQQLRRLLLLQLEAERPVERLPPRREVFARDIELRRGGWR